MLHERERGGEGEFSRELGSKSSREHHLVVGTAGVRENVWCWVVCCKTLKCSRVTPFRVPNRYPTHAPLTSS